MVGKRVYQPWVLTAYSIAANVPLATFLYGVNVQRRGNNIAGNILKAVSALAMILVTIAAAVVETRIRGIHLFGIVLGIGLMRAELLPYRQAISSGATPASWWPPLLFLLAQMAAIMTLAYVYDNIE